MLFNEKLKMLRKEKGYTQEELSDKLNVSRQAITKWESGDGFPDIENLKQISILFEISIDELVKEDKDIKFESSYIEELEIDHIKHFDIKISKINELNIIANEEEKVKIEVLSNDKNIKDLFKIKFDDLYNRLDINIKSKENIESVINIYLPIKYIDSIELNSKMKKLNIYNLDFESLEYDGSLKYLNVNGSKGDIVLNTSKCDIEAHYDKFDGSLEVNTINSVSRVEIPKGTIYKTILKGIKNEFIDSNSIEESNNTIELNGMNSKLIVKEY